MTKNIFLSKNIFESSGKDSSGSYFVVGYILKTSARKTQCN